MIVSFSAILCEAKETISQEVQEGRAKDGKSQRITSSSSSRKDPSHIRHHGHGYVTFTLVRDLSRFEISDLLFAAGWKLAGFSSLMDGSQQISKEKWTNKSMKPKSTNKKDKRDDTKY